MRKEYDKVGIGIVTYNSSCRLQTAISNIPEYLEHVVIVNDGTPYDMNVYGDRFDIIQHVKNKGVAGAKNSAMRYLYGKGCEHIFLMEDDIVIKDFFNISNGSISLFDVKSIVKKISNNKNK